MVFLCYTLQTIMIAILLLLNVINIHALWIYELLPNNLCGIDLQRRDFEAVVWPWVSAIVNVYVPLTVSAVLTVLLVSRTRHSYGSPATAAALDHPEIDDVQLMWVWYS